MPKFFVISDVHSFYTPMKEALDAAGFDPDDEDHWLISCGDNFDRGSESVEVLRYLRRLQRKILIKGNHELLWRSIVLEVIPNHMIIITERYIQSTSWGMVISSRNELTMRGIGFAL